MGTKAVMLNFPRNGNLVDPENVFFQWKLLKSTALGKRISCTLIVYALKPGTTPAQAVKRRPVYTAKELKKTFHKYNKKNGLLQVDRMYCWRIRAESPETGKVIFSDMHIFRLRRHAEITVATTEVVLPGLDPTDFFPHAPIVFGKPVVMRPRSASAEPDAEPDDSGTVEPMPLMLWGTESAHLFLVEPLYKHANVWWDHSDVPGCEKVVLQIAGPDGFERPNSENEALDDPGVMTWYSGPVTLPANNCLGTAINIEDDPLREVPVHSVNLQYRDAAMYIESSYLYMRLVSVDSGLRQVAPASDHVSIDCVDTPLIKIPEGRCEWIWGETPRRRITFTLELQRRFPSTLIVGSVSVPVTFVIAGRTNSTTEGIKRFVLSDVELEVPEGVSVPVYGTWRDKPAYFVKINRWNAGDRYTFTLEQSRPPAATGLVGALYHFCDCRLEVQCLPGIDYNWYNCGGRIYDNKVPDWIYDSTETYNACHLYEAYMNSDAYAHIYRLFTGTLTGRRVSSRDGERDVRVTFTFTKTFDDAEDFMIFLLRGEVQTGTGITMIESRDGTLYSYKFSMLGFHASMWSIGEPLLYYHGEGTCPGKLVFKEDGLDMHFIIDYFEPVDGGSGYESGSLSIEYFLTLDD